MPPLEDLLAGLTRFAWDDGNATKNWERHHVTQAEAEEVFFNQPVVLASATASERERRYNVFGHTNGDRLLSVIFTTRNGLVRVISARPMSRKERHAYTQVPPESS